MTISTLFKILALFCVFLVVVETPYKGRLHFREMRKIGDFWNYWLTVAEGNKEKTKIFEF